METQQTTQQLQLLKDELNNLQHLVKAQRTRIAFLELRLKQRFEKTTNYYRQIQPFLKSMRDKVFKIFLELPASVGLSHKEIIMEFQNRYPDANVKNIPRRVRELTVGVDGEEPRLFSHTEEDGTVKFFLRLKD